jgi:DNA-binding GntR family transcriptional regulator
MVRLEHSGLVEAELAQMSRVQRLSLETICSHYVLREACETQAIRLACESATDQEIAELYQLAGQVDTQVQQGKLEDELAPSLHWEFHKRIAELSRYGILLRELERIGIWQRMRRLWLAQPLLPDPVQHHTKLVDAIKKHGAEKADAVMRAHVRRGLETEIRAYHLRIKG